MAIPLLNGCTPEVATACGVTDVRAPCIRTDAGPAEYISDVLHLYTSGTGAWAVYGSATGFEAWVCAQVSRDPALALRTVVAFSPMLIDRAFVAETHLTRRAAFTLDQLVHAIEDARHTRGLPRLITQPPTIHRDTFQFTNPSP